MKRLTVIDKRTGQVASRDFDDDDPEAERLKRAAPREGYEAKLARLRMQR
jgi:hypothetical protein